jgi:hypothetical protein
MDLNGATDHTIPSAPDVFEDVTVKKPPGIPPGGGVLPDVAVSGADSAIAGVLIMFPLYSNARKVEFSPIT